ncbi:MAG: DUF2339 domain-containing protein [candidate division Zixibacteria bacterium]
MDDNFENRVVRLENAVKNLQQSVDYLLANIEIKTKPAEPHVSQKTEIKPQKTEQPQITPSSPESYTPHKTTLVKHTTKPFTLPEHMKTSEYWLNKVGIALIILSAIFAFKYSIDKGWITPPIRIAFGVALGAVLMFFGLKTYKKNKHFSQVLMGGGIATFYVTIFAAFQTFSLVSHPVAFACMIIVTATAYLIAIRQNESVLSIIGVFGGLGTPFLLYTGSGNIPGLTLYLSLLLTCSCTIYFFKGWRMLLFFTVLGHWIILSAVQAKGLPADFSAAVFDRWSLQSSIIFTWLMLWIPPVAREILARLKPNSWTHSPLLFGGKPVSNDIQSLVKNYVHVLTVSSPLIALGLSMNLWAYSDKTWGWIMAGAAIIYGLASWILTRWKVRNSLIYTHILFGMLCFTISLSLLLEGNTLLVVLTGEAFVLFLIARRLNDRVIKVTSHILYGVLGIVVIVRMLLPFYEQAALSADSISNLLLIMATCVVAYFSSLRLQQRIYFVFAAIALDLWLDVAFTGNILLILFTSEILAIHFIAFRWSDKIALITGYVITGITASWVMIRLFVESGQGLTMLNWQAATDILFIAAIISIALKLIRDSKFCLVYLLASHIFILALLHREFSHLPNGQGFVSAVWGAYAILLIIGSLRLNNYHIRWTGLATLGLVIGKLLLIDLKQIDAIWRVLLFLGLGGVILFVSYYFQSLWKKDAGTGSALEKSNNSDPDE